MLVLTLDKDDSIWVGRCRIMIADDMRQSSVRLAFDAPADVRIVRQRLLDRGKPAPRRGVSDVRKEVGG